MYINNVYSAHFRDIFTGGYGLWGMDHPMIFLDLSESEENTIYVYNDVLSSESSDIFR